MITEQHECAICQKQTIAFHYGVNCCNACKQFFKRSVDSKSLPMKCLNGSSKCSHCRYCRFQMCLSAGMVAPSRQAFEKSKPDLGSVLSHLEQLENRRNDTFMNCVTTSEFNLDDLILADTLEYSKKPEDFKPGFEGWVAMCFSTSVDFIKRFEFNKDLTKSEKINIIKPSFRQHATLSLAMRSYSNHREFTAFPDGLDILPVELSNQFKDCPKFLNKIRCSLIAKLHELQITEQEYLLLGAIMICNTVSEIFSTSSQNHVSKYQKLFINALMEYCLIKHSNNGGSRFADLLSILNVITQVLENFDNAVIQMHCSEPTKKMDKVLVDIVEKKI